MNKFIDTMPYFKNMQSIDNSLMQKVLELRDKFKYNTFTKSDVIKALNKENIGINELMAILSTAGRECLEELAQAAKTKTIQYFGNSIEIFTPLYISNFCDSNCSYCGFSSKNKISRLRLSDGEIYTELKNIARSGLKDVLILTGESFKKGDLEYIGKACKMASELFSNVGVEIYPLNSDEYAFLHSCGVDYVVVFQETYDTKSYKNVHLGGAKQIFSYRFNAQERALMGGMRSVGFGALLGLSDFRKDAFSTAIHAHFIQQKYPHAEIALSVPRLRPTLINADINPKDVDEKSLFQVICAYRIFLPYANITISTRESEKFRNGVVGIAASKISAGVSVGVGSGSTKKSGDEQFIISDRRSVDEILKDMQKLELAPVISNHIYV